MGVINSSILSRDDFTEYIAEIQNTLSYRYDMNRLLDRYRAGGCLMQPDCVAPLLKLLNRLMGISKYENYIEKFCEASTAGNRKKPVTFLTQNNIPVEISDAGKLYDYLVSQQETDGQVK